MKWGRIFWRGGGFFVANLAPGAISFYPGGDICRRRSYFMTLRSHFCSDIMPWKYGISTRENISRRK